jgi:hypothetical protein
MSDEEKKFYKEINIDKAKNKTVKAIILIILSILTYVEPLIYGEFDFGVILEVISLVSLLIARRYMTQYDEKRSKRYIVCSIISIGWILIYDAIILILSIRNAADIVLLGDYFFFGEIISILYIITLFAINRDLAKADNPVKYKESTDWFYENYENKDEESKKI